LLIVNRLCLEFVILSNPWDVMVYLLETEFKLLAVFLLILFF
jgi:hypothetical protein